VSIERHTCEVCVIRRTGVKMLETHADLRETFSGTRGFHGIRRDARPDPLQGRRPTYDHLPPHLQAVSEPFCQLAEKIVEMLPSNPERTVTLRKLLEAKDCAARALIYKES
jgi:hypothetical protein